MDWFVSTVYASGITGLPNAASQISNEGNAWLYWGVVIAIIVGMATIALSGRMQSELIQIFGYIISKLGAGAFGVVAVALVGMIGLSAASPVVPVLSSVSRVGLFLECLSQLWASALFFLPTVGVLTMMVSHARRR